ncbi:hypothetical protein DRO54_08890 [Candidatus Bathyarchaeota archaeon]|nr:MAG: hypothetical protein DRO54_08890 [Candidatus Bathyarchaeota archaeon]
MSKYLIIENPPAELWNEFLTRSSYGNFEQCYESGEISKLAFPKTKTVRFAAICNGKFVGIIQGTYSSYLGFGMTLGIMRAPVVDVEDNRGYEIARNLLRALEDYAKRNRIIEARILVPEKWNFDEIFRSLGYKMAGKLNEYVVNLEGDVEKLWRRISHNKRRNIKKAMKEGVEVIQSRDPKDLLTFYSMLVAAEKRGGFLSYPLSWFKAVWKLYKPELSKVFLARWNGKEVSGVFTVIHGKTIYALAAGSFSEGWKVRPNDIMHWKVMEWACRNGLTGYHMGLVSDPPPSKGSNAWGVWRWKREWKGKLYRLLIYEKTFLPKYTLILKIKRAIQKGYETFKKLM